MPLAIKMQKIIIIKMMVFSIAIRAIQIKEKSISDCEMIQIIVTKISDSIIKVVKIISSS